MPQNKSEDKPVHRNPIHSAKEQKQNRFVVIGFIIIAALIVGLIGYAFLYEGVLKDNIAVAKVNGTEIDNKYFQDRVRLERNSYIQQFLLINRSITVCRQRSCVPGILPKPINSDSGAA